VYDVTSMTSFNHVKDWLKELKQFADSNIVILLVGNKTDLKDKREVKKEEAAQYADQHHLAFIETSALDCSNVDVAFDRIITGKKYITLNDLLQRFIRCSVCKRRLMTTMTTFIIQALSKMEARTGKTRRMKWKEERTVN
jgi:GTPase SAR1 family protein